VQQGAFLTLRGWTSRQKDVKMPWSADELEINVVIVGP
jgi:hypothetical protein